MTNEIEIDAEFRLNDDGELEFQCPATTWRPKGATVWNSTSTWTSVEDLAQMIKESIGESSS